jgi:hypothetical protein
MGVASCRSIFLLSDVVFNRASVSPRFEFSICNWIPISGRACSGFPSWPATLPSPAWPLVACPWRPQHPHAPTPSLSFCFPRSNSLSLSFTSLPPLCPRCDPVDGYRRFLDPKVSSPPPPLSLPPLSLPYARPCPPAAWLGLPGARPCPPRRASMPSLRALLPPGDAARPPQRASLPMPGARPCPRPERVPAPRWRDPAPRWHDSAPIGASLPLVARLAAPGTWPSAPRRAAPDPVARPA